MVEHVLTSNLVNYVIGGVIVVFAGWDAYHMVKTGWLYRSLSGVEPDTGGAVADGEQVAIEGPVTVEDPAPASELAVPDSGRTGMYVWRAAKTDVGSNKIDFRNLRVRADRDTVGSGIEAGTLTVTSGGTAVRVDPSWIREAHDAPKLSDFTVVPGMGYKNFRHYLWDTPYVHLAGDEVEVELERLEGVIEKHDAETSLDDLCLQSRPVREGDTLSVYGEVDSTGGTSVLRGTDETPLFVTNDGFDGLRSHLRKQAGGKAIGFGFWAVIAAAILLYSV